MAHSYPKGQAIKCTAEFKDGDTGAYIDPTTVMFRELDPSGNAADHVYGVDVNVVKESVGNYYYILTLDEAGTWHYRWVCTGTYVGAEDNVVHVCAPAYASW